MPAITIRRPAAAVSTAPTVTPRQGDLLDALNSTATPPAAHKEAKKLLKLWYPMSYQVWAEHNG
jgi:hypothetical protein